MAVITKEQVTNLFLYGTEHKPTDLTDEALLTRSAGSTSVSEAQFMSEIWGDGQLNFSMFEHVQRFLQGEGTFSSGSKTQDEIISEFGLVNTYHIEKQLVDYNDGSSDFYEKVYIWNTGRFILHDNVRFIVESNGDRRIENLAIVTFNSENFDFVTSDENGWAGRHGNAFFESQIDPQGIGQTVTINFNHDISEFVPTYTLADLNQDIQDAPDISDAEHYANLVDYAQNGIRNIIPSLTSSLSDPGVQVQDGRKVVYGHSVIRDGIVDINDTLEPIFRNEFHGYSVYGFDDYLGQYSGFHFLGGNGDDVIYGSAGSDFFAGGADNDTYIFNTTFNIGNDFIDDQSGNNHIVLDGRLSDRYINGMTITEVDPGTGVYYELDTGGDVVEGLKFVLSAQNGGGSQLAIQLSPSLLSGSGRITIQNFNAANYGLTLVGGNTDDFEPDAPTVTSGADVIGDGKISSTQIKPRFLSNLNSQARIYDASEYDWNFNVYNGENYSSATKYFGGSNFNDILLGSYFDAVPENRFDEALYGFDGDDAISGEGINETQGDADLIVGGRGNDYLYGGPGNDIIYGNNDSNIDSGPVVFNHNQYFKDVTLIDGTSTENAGDVDFIDGGTGNDIIRAGSGDDFLVGGQGNDEIYGFAGSDIIRGGSGEDKIWGDAYGMHNESLGRALAEVDYDSTAFTDYDDIIYGGSGDDYIIGEYGDDIIEGGDDNDYIVGDSNIGDVEDYRQIPVELHGNDILKGGAGNDTIYGGGGNDILEGGDGEDYLTGDAGNDTIYGNDDADVLWGDNDVGLDVGGDDILYGGAGDDHLYGDGTGVLIGGKDILYGGEGSDVLMGYGGSDTLYGGNGNDNLYADVSSSVPSNFDKTTNYLYGEAGDDQLQGGDGDDVLVGGTGTDLLVGNDGWDSYIFEEGDGQIDSSNNVDGILDSDIGLLQINAQVTGTVYNSSADLIQINYGSNDYLLVSVEGFTSVQNRIYAGVETEFTSTSNGNLRYIVGDAEDNILSTDDVTVSNLHSHSIYLNDGDDRFTYTYGNGDAIAVWGGEGDDILDLQGGDSVVFNGGAGADTIMFGLGSSQHIIDLAQSTDSSDRVLIKNGVSLGDVAFQRSNDDLVISLVSSVSDELILDDYFAPGSDQLSTIEFSTGAKFTKNSMAEYLDTGSHIVGDSGANTLETPNSGGVLNGLGGNDTLTVDFITPYTPNPDAIGDDIFYGGDGDDYFFSHYGNDTLFGEAGSDTINAGYGDDYLSGGDGNDYLYGSYGNDTLTGDGGNDVMHGQEGYDTYLWGEGFGNDQIENWSYVPHEQSDELLIVGELTASDIDWSRSGSSLVGEIIDTQETITISRWFDGFVNVLDKIKFESGGSIDGIALDISLRFDVLEGTESAESMFGTSGEDLMFGLAGNDFLSGGADDDVIYGGDGDDYLDGGDGDDVLLGGDGLDWLMGGGDGSDFLDIGVNTSGNPYYQSLIGGTGSDLYSFGTNFGNAWVNAGDGYYSEDSMQFTDTGPENLWFSQDADDLIIDVIGTDNQIIVDNWFLDDKYELTDIYTEGFVMSNVSTNGIDALISAMASYDVPSGAGNVVPQAVKDALAPTMANVWQETDRRMVHYY